MKTVTCWYRITEDGLKFNHVSEGNILMNQR